MPTESSLLEYRMKILKVQETEPNIIEKSEDGKIFNYQLAMPLYSKVTGKRRFSGLSAVDANRLTGCDTKIFGAYLDYSFQKQFRVWKVECSRGSISYEVMKNKYLEETKSDSKGNYFISILILIFVFFLLEKIISKIEGEWAEPNKRTRIFH